MPVSDGRMRRRRTRIFLALWFVVIVAFFTWQSGAYSGVVALLAEWQFNEFGVYLPLLTLLLLIAVLAPIPAVIARALQGRNRKTATPRGTAPARTMADALRFRNFLGFAAGSCVIAAIIALLLILGLPTDQGTVQQLGATASAPQPHEGPAEIRGSILYTRTSAFDEHLWFYGRNVRFAPVVEHGVDDTVVRYFVELPPTNQFAPATTGEVAVRRGILKRNGLPGEIQRLYQYAGYSLSDPHYVLFSSAEVMRWPFFAWASEFAIAGVLIGLAGLVQTLRCRRLSHRIAQSTDESLTAR